MNLRDRGRTFRAKTSAAGGMLRIAFKLRNSPDFLIDVGKKPARRFAVETDRGNKLVVFLDAARPSFGIVLDPIVPLLDGRLRGEVAAVALEIGHC
jgi:hypothetical protein